MVSLRNSHLTCVEIDERCGNIFASVILLLAMNILVFALFERLRLAFRFGFGISRFLFFSGTEIARLLNIFMDSDSIFTHRDEGRTRIDPGPAIVIIDSVLVLMQGGMGVAAENARRVMVAGVC